MYVSEINVTSSSKGLNPYENMVCSLLSKRVKRRKRRYGGERKRETRRGRRGWINKNIDERKIFIKNNDDDMRNEGKKAGCKKKGRGSKSSKRRERRMKEMKRGMDRGEKS